MAARYFGNDGPWFLANIPFLEIDDPVLQRIYYYRWQLYRSHIREIGEQGTDVTEFLTNVPWARQPYTDLNDSSSFQILEGRWLRNPVYVHSLVDHLYAGGGNDRHFSESIASATLGWVEVTGDPAPALVHLDTMEHVFNLWDDHFDAARGLYWIEPLLDATEYTISSIDASGAGFTHNPSLDQNRNGFTGGYAFRPSINAYQFANARSIAQLATLAGKPAIAKTYAARAEAIRSATLEQLWNAQLGHFTDVYQRSTLTVEKGSFIRGRELVGFVPWQFDLVPSTPQWGQPDFASAWSHLLAPAQLAGVHGLRTVEPSYPMYLTQYRYDALTGQPECQWNGPAWPFQISQTLSGMANLLQASPPSAPIPVTVNDYVRLLRQYARLHLNTNADGAAPDLQEDYNPDTGLPIVGLQRSHHYNHSTFNDLLLSGLIGIRPRLDDVLELHPLLPTGHDAEPPIRFFALQDVRYHGRDLTLLYDADGSRYRKGAGLSVFTASGQRIYGPRPLGPAFIHLTRVHRDPAMVDHPPEPDLAVNVWEREPSAFETTLPIATASSSATGSSPYAAIDGRLWFFPEVSNGWSPAVDASRDNAPWIAVDLRRSQTLNAVDLAFFADGATFAAPEGVTLQTLQDGHWEAVPQQSMEEQRPVANGLTHLHFRPVQTQMLRVVFRPARGKQLRLIELEAFARFSAALHGVERGRTASRAIPLHSPYQGGFGRTAGLELLSPQRAR